MMVDLVESKLYGREMTAAWQAFDSGFRAAWQHLNPGKPMDVHLLSRLSLKYTQDLIAVQEKSSVAKRSQRKLGRRDIPALPPQGGPSGSLDGNPPGSQPKSH